jgi:hypothetical protein
MRCFVCMYYCAIIFSFTFLLVFLCSYPRGWGDPLRLLVCYSAATCGKILLRLTTPQKDCNKDFSYRKHVYQYFIRRFYS